MLRQFQMQQSVALSWGHEEGQLTQGPCVAFLIIVAGHMIMTSTSLPHSGHPIHFLFPWQTHDLSPNLSLHNPKQGPQNSNAVAGGV